jgi:hypothetical protein
MDDEDWKKLKWPRIADEVVSIRDLDDAKCSGLGWLGSGFFFYDEEVIIRWWLGLKFGTK